MNSLEKDITDKSIEEQFLPFNKFIEFLSLQNNICVSGKGKLENDIPDIYDLYVGVKQSVAVLPRKDIFILNDFEGVFGLEQIFKDIKYILCPAKPHIGWGVGKITYKDVLEYANSFGFTGKIVIYELWTNPKKKRMVKVPMIESWNSGDIIFHCFKHCSNYKNKCFNLYGLCKSKEDNSYITGLIKSANVLESYKNEFNAYLNRTYPSIKKRKELAQGNHWRLNNRFGEHFSDFNMIIN